MVKNWFKNKNFSEISPQILKNISLGIVVFLLLIFFYACFEIYVPINPGSHETIIYTVQKGWGDDEIAKDLENLKIIRSNDFSDFMWSCHSSIQNCKQENIICLPGCPFTRLQKKWRKEML